MIINAMFVEMGRIKGILGRPPIERKIMLLDNGRDDPWCKVTKNLAELCLCSGVLWMVELVRNETGYLARHV